MERLRAIQRMWRTKDVQAIKDHTARVLSVAEKKADRQQIGNVTVVDFRRGR